MRLAQNVMSLNIFRNYNDKVQRQKTQYETISSGQKIKNAKDNPNGMAKSEMMRIQIKGLAMAERNLQDGVSMLQTVDSGLDAIGNSLIRMKELVVQAENGTYSEEERQAIQVEIDQLKEDIITTSNNTEFNGVPLINNKYVADNNNPAYKQLLSGANSGDSIKIPLFNASPEMLKDNKGFSVNDINVLEDNGQSNIDIIDSALQSINSMRSEYGAIQSRLEATTNNVAENQEMFQRAESSITSADIAEEMIEYTKNDILIQTSTALFAQSNKFPQDVLQILQNMKS